MQKKIWETLCKFQMKLVCLSPAEFIHFGTTTELLKLLTEEINDYEFLDWRPNVFTNTQRVESAIHDGLLEKDVVLEDGCYIESSWLAGSTVVKGGNRIPNDPAGYDCAGRHRVAWDPSERAKRISCAYICSNG